jgi:hypothetical protein
MTKDLCSVCGGIFVRSRRDRRKADRNENIKDRGQPFFIHHETVEGLKKAVGEGCRLCASLSRSLSVQEKAGLAQPHNSARAILHYYLSTSKPYFVVFRIHVSEDGSIKRSFSLRPEPGRPFDRFATL